MTCQHMKRLLSDEREQPRSERESAAMGAHLRSCPACCRLQRDLAAVETGLRELVRELPDREVDFVNPAIDRVLAMRGGKRNGLHVLVARPARRLSLGSAAAALLLLTFYWWGRGHGPAPDRSAVAVGAPSGQTGPALPATPQPTGDKSQGRIRTMQPRPAGGAEVLPPPHTAALASNNSPMRPGRRWLVSSNRRRRSAADDLAYMNRDPEDADREWAPLTQDEWEKIEARARAATRVRDDFVTIPFPRLASTSERQIAQAVESYKREAAIVDPRLSHEVTCAFKATALSDLCNQLRSETGIDLTAGPSVADEKVTVFCEKLPLRDAMRQLSRPFGYTWLRSKREGGEYRYELVQDLHSQLLEEELRNRDRNEALIALDREMNRYRKYLDLSPDEALARAKTAPPEEKNRLEHLATDGWGLIQIYFRLSPNEMAALRAGQRLIFSQEPKAGEQPLPADLARGILQSERDNRIFERDGAFRLGDAKANPDGMLATAVPAARAKLMLRMPQSELGEFTLTGGPGVFISAGSQTPGGFSIIGSAGSLAIGRSPAVLDPNNGAANAPLARDPALHPHVTVVPEASCQASIAGEPGEARFLAPEKKVTSADVLEALHRATGRPIVSDFYTRLYPLPAVTVRSMPLLDALDRLSDAMRLRWGKDGAWLQFRGTGFFNDRLKEVPNRLLTRWSASRRQHGSATLDDLIEMAQLSDAQLDAVDMREGAKECWGLAEWDLVRRSSFRPQLRFLAGFTPDQRRMATGPSGLSFTRLSLAQQQQFLSFLLRPDARQLPSGEEMSGATLRVDYSLPGAFQWARPESGWRQFLPPPVREPTREAALRAALRIDPQATDAQIAPTSLALSFLHTPGGPNVDAVRMVRTDRDGWWQP